MRSSVRSRRSTNRALAATAVVCLIFDSACSKQPATTPPPAAKEVSGVLVVDGNSWTQSRHGAVAVPENVWKQLGSPEHFRVVDEAESGVGMAQMIDPKHQQRVDGHVVKGQSNVLLLWEGCHDLAEGHSAEETARRLRDYYQRRKAARFAVVSLTLLPCCADDWPADYATKRDAVNKMILASPADYGDFVVDVTDLTGPDVFSPIDKVHLTDSSSTEVAKRVASVLRPVLLKQD